MWKNKNLLVDGDDAKNLPVADHSNESFTQRAAREANEKAASLRNGQALSQLIVRSLQDAPVTKKDGAKR